MAKRKLFQKAVKAGVKLTNAAAKIGIPTAVVASRVLNAPKVKKRMDSYINKAGETPHKHPIGKAIQSAMIHDR